MQSNTNAYTFQNNRKAMTMMTNMLTLQQVIYYRVIKWMSFSVNK